MSGSEAEAWREEDGLWIDEGPLRDSVLKAYHEKWADGGQEQSLLEAVRELLSGPAGGPSVPGQYYFESEPLRHVPAFCRALDRVADGLDRTVYEPLLHAIAEKEAAGEEELAPNLTLYVASLAGPIAVRNEIDETLACALVSAALITLARLGRERVAELVEAR